MRKRERARDLGVPFGGLKTGRHNCIADVPGVAVAHHTVKKGDIISGFTIVLPHGGNLYQEKMFAGCAILNGFGKSAGLMLIQEVGALESAVVLTNTMAVGTAFNGIVQHSIKQNPGLGLYTGAVNPVVLECNDGYFLSNIQKQAFTAEEVVRAIESAKGGPVEEGCVGAGTGMSAIGFKSGIGTASREVEVGGETFTIGAIGLPNFDMDTVAALKIADREVRPKKPVVKPMKDAGAGMGSYVMVLATDAPLIPSQLRRISLRALMALGRVGSSFDNRSGDIAVAFSTAYKLTEVGKPFVKMGRIVSHNSLNKLFCAAMDISEECIINALAAAETTVGRHGFTAEAIGRGRIRKMFRKNPG